ncbi:hypothetical protein ACTXT7_012660 [Hymenolepis weldensis]
MTTLKQVEVPRGVSLVYLRRKITTGLKKSIEEMIGDNVRADSSEVIPPTVIRSKLPATVMVFGVLVVSSEGRIITSHFFPQSLRVNADA